MYIRVVTLGLGGVCFICDDLRTFEKYTAETFFGRRGNGACSMTMNQGGMGWVRWVGGVGGMVKGGVVC